MAFPEKYTITMKHYREKRISIEKIALLFRKGVFPHDYINSVEKFQETKLPPIEEFHSKLHGKISQKDYEHA